MFESVSVSKSMYPSEAVSVSVSMSVSVLSEVSFGVGDLRCFACKCSFTAMNPLPRPVIGSPPPVFCTGWVERIEVSFRAL